MKVGSITHNRNISIESKGSKEKASFSDSFNMAHRAKTNHQAQRNGKEQRKKENLYRFLKARK